MAAASQSKGRVTAPRLWWKGAAKQVTWPVPAFVQQRKAKKQTGERAALPWRLPLPLSLDQQMMRDYRIFKAAGLLQAWFSLYQAVLNLKPSPMAP